MKYYVSSITDVVSEEADGDWEKLTYVDRTAELVSANGLGIELAEFCISDNMDNSYDAVLPHVLRNCEASPDRTLHAPYNELFPMAIEPLVVEVAYKRYVQTLDYCKRFGAKKMIVHANYTEALYFPNWFIKRHIDFWKRFLAENNLEGIDITKPGITPNRPDWADKAKGAVGVILETADPAKFSAIVKDATGAEPPIPERLQKLMTLPDRAIPMENDYNKFKAWLVANL